MKESEIAHDDSNVSNDTSWTALYERIWKREESRVRDCQEEVDSHVVFSGILSIVTAAFLVNSSRSIREASTREALSNLLRQIDQQRSLAGENMNAPDFASFIDAPSPSVIQSANFMVASLLLSLFTAFSAIALRQWLKEYRTFDYTSPQQLLRAALYRYPGSGSLFLLTSLLPLSLQASLGLFFVGLCLSVPPQDTAVRITGWTLFGIWASVIVFSLVHPIFSLSSPFKAPYLKGIHISIRSFMHNTLGLQYKSASEILESDAFSRRKNPVACFEEEAFAERRNASETIDILIATDARLGHQDEIVPHILSAVDHLKKDLPECFKDNLDFYANYVTAFSFSFICMRLGVPLFEFNQQSQYRYDITGRFSLQAWTLLVDRWAKQLQLPFSPRYLERGRPDWRFSLPSLVSLLLTRTEHPLPPLGCEALALALTVDPVGAADCICSRARLPIQPAQPKGDSGDSQADFFSSLVLRDIKGVMDCLSGKTLADALFHLLRACYFDTKSESIEEFFRLNPIGLCTTVVPHSVASPMQVQTTLEGTLLPTLTLLLKSVDSSLSNPSQQEVEWCRDIVSFIFQCQSYWTDDHLKVVQSWMVRRPYLDTLYRFVCPHEIEGANVSDSALSLVYNSLAFKDRMTVIRSTGDMLRERYTIELITGENKSRIDYLRLAQFLLQCTVQDKDRSGSSSRALVKSWKKMYPGLGFALRLYLRRNRCPSRYDLIRECNSLAASYFGDAVPAGLSSSLSVFSRAVLQVVDGQRSK